MEWLQKEILKSSLLSSWQEKKPAKDKDKRKG
jgi:hypothetical protein